jgi:hypothetical protein
MKIKPMIFLVVFFGVSFLLLFNCKKEVPTAIVLPTITTAELSYITSNTAKGGGNITNDGGSPITFRGVCWSTSPTPTISDSKTSDGTGTGSFTSSITGLLHGRTYFFRAYAANSMGTSYGNQITKSTTAVLPTINTATLSDITSTTATVRVNIIDDGGSPIISRGVCWSTSPTPTISDSKTSDGTGSGSFTSSMTGLIAGTTYYFRAYATNDIGTSYGGTSAVTVTVPDSSVAGDVFVTGWENNGNRSAVKVWKNGMQTSIVDGYTPITANSVFVSGNDVYVAGQQNGVAKVWKNGIPISLTDGKNYAEAYSVFVSSSDVYVAGWESNGTTYVAKVWKNGVPTSLTDGTSSSHAFSVFVSGSDMYVAGEQRPVAKVWKNGVPISLTDGTNYAEANSVFVSGSDVYVAGYEPNGTGWVAKVWKNGVPTSLTDGTKFAEANSVFVSGSDVYVAGYEFVSFTNPVGVAKVWKNGILTSLTDGTKSAAAYSVYVSGSDVYVAGFESNGTTYVAKVWKNGVPTSLTDGTKPANATSVFVK